MHCRLMVGLTWLGTSEGEQTNLGNCTYVKWCQGIFHSAEALLAYFYK